MVEMTNKPRKHRNSNATISQIFKPLPEKKCANNFVTKPTSLRLVYNKHSLYET